MYTLFSNILYIAIITIHMYKATIYKTESCLFFDCWNYMVSQLRWSLGYPIHI